MIKIINRIKSFATFVLLVGVYLIGCSESGISENMVNKFIVHDASFTEGNANHIAEIRISIDGSLVSELTVPFEIDEGTATFGADIIQTDGEIIFYPGEQEEVIPVEIIGDEYFELTETFELRLHLEGKTTLYNISITDNDEMAEILTNSEGFYTPAEYPSMTLKWSDEFDAEELNTAYWTYEIGDGCDQGICGWGNEELETYTNDEANSRLEDGNLIITARKENGEYTSARIKTEDKVEMQFGRIDVRAKLPKGQGIWPAIWMLGANISQVGWPACGEIDIMELVGHQPEAVHGTVHFDNNGYQSSTGSHVLTNGDFSDQFHVFTIIWERDRISWYVDNEKFKTFTKSGIDFYPFNAPFYFIMNVAVGGRWPGNPDQTTVFPQEMVVDYIRVFH
ncbi:MAG: family 16 glycosylhydrolase [Balneolaceae bacterium]|nr:family 16 glycosylhydrolase [Balneolaceae bacterium]